MQMQKQIWCNVDYSITAVEVKRNLNVMLHLGCRTWFIKAKCRNMMLMSSFSEYWKCDVENLPNSPSQNSLIVESELSPVACTLHNSQPCHGSQTLYTHFTLYTLFFTLRTLLYTQITFSIQVPQLSTSRVANIPSTKHCENTLKAWSIFHYMRWNFYWKHCPDLSHLL